MKTDLELCKKHAVRLGNGFYTVRLDGFAEACYDENSESDLREALKLRAADKNDCESWSIKKTEWRDSIESALAAKIIEANNDQLPTK